MSLNFLFRATTRKDWEAMARTAEFIGSGEANMNKPLPGISVDPLIGTPEYETGIPIIEVPSPDQITPPVMKSGWHCNVRITGERERQEIEGLSQVDEDGNLLPVAARTHFGIEFVEMGTVTADGATGAIVYANVALINELTIVSPQRVWQ